MSMWPTTFLKYTFSKGICYNLFLLFFFFLFFFFLQPGDDSPDSTGPFVTCLSCGGDFQFNVMKAHSERCNRYTGFKKALNNVVDGQLKMCLMLWWVRYRYTTEGKF